MSSFRIIAFQRPAVCPGCCGRVGTHAWNCPVAVRLCAQFFASEAQRVESERDRPAKLEAAQPDAWSPAATHWRSVASLSSIVAPAETPEILPLEDGSGVVELRAGESPLNFPSGLSLLEKIRTGPFGDVLDRVSPGWGVVPFAFLVPGDPVPTNIVPADEPAAENPADDESPFFDLVSEFDPDFGPSDPDDPAGLDGPG